MLGYSSGRIGASIILVNSVSFCFTRFYGNPKSKLRHFSCDLLLHLHSISDLLWLALGVLNEILLLDEKTGGARNYWQIDNFHDKGPGSYDCI